MASFGDHPKRGTGQIEKRYIPQRHVARIGMMSKARRAYEARETCPSAFAGCLRLSIQSSGAMARHAAGRKRSEENFARIAAARLRARTAVRDRVGRSIHSTNEKRAAANVAMAAQSVVARPAWASTG